MTVAQTRGWLGEEEPTGWRSKQVLPSTTKAPLRTVHTAHYIERDGKPLCAARLAQVGGGELRASAFATRWISLRYTDHLCTLCRAKQPAPCHCGACSAR